MRRLPGFLLAMAALPAACQTAPAGSSSLARTSWRIAAIDGRATPPTGGYFMTFGGRDLGGKAGCNSFGGDYRVSGRTLTTGALVMTEMACGEPANSFESRALAIIQRPMTVLGARERLTLSNDVGAIDLIRAP